MTRLRALALSMTVAASLVLAARPAHAQTPAQRAAGLRPLAAAEVAKTVPAGIAWIADIAYREGNPAWTLDLAKPAGEASAPRPAVVIVHGGGWEAGDKRTRAFARYPIEYAKAGFVAVSVNYRLSGEAPFPACIEDVKNAVRWLRAHADEHGVDPDRIGAYGNSAGAHLVALLGLAGPGAGLEGDGPYQDRSSAVRAVIASATPTDFLDWEESTGSPAAAKLLAGPEATREARTRLASPLAHVRGDAPAFLLIHGTDDRTVPYVQAKRLVLALVEAGATDVAFRSYPGGRHLAYTDEIAETLPMSLAFFARTLGPVE